METAALEAQAHLVHLLLYITFLFGLVELTSDSYMPQMCSTKRVLYEDPCSFPATLLITLTSSACDGYCFLGMKVQIHK